MFVLVVFLKHLSSKKSRNANLTKKIPPKLDFLVSNFGGSHQEVVFAIENNYLHDGFSIRLKNGGKIVITISQMQGLSLTSCRP